MVTLRDVWKLYDISTILIKMGKGVFSSDADAIVEYWTRAHQSV